MKKLIVNLVKGDNMKPMDKNGKSDPYVKLTYNDQQFKSKAQKKTLSPVWNEKFTFKDVKDDGTLKIEVFDYDFGSKDDLMGSYNLAINSIPLGKTTKNVTLSDSAGVLKIEFFHLVSLGKSEFEIKENLKKVFEESTLTDAVILVEGKTIKVHKCIISRSEVLKKKSEKGEIEIAGKYNTAKLLCEFLYTDEFPIVDVFQYVELASMAKELKLLHFAVECEKSAVKLLTIENVYDVINTSVACNQSFLISKSIEFFKNQKCASNIEKTKILSQASLFAIVTAETKPAEKQPEEVQNYLTNHILSLSSTGAYSDLKLTTSDKKEFQTHKIILLTHSDYFQKLLGKSLKDLKGMNEFDLDINSYNVLDLVLKIIYGEKIDLDSMDADTLLNISNLSKSLEMKELSYFVEMNLSNFVTKKNAKKLAMFAIEYQLDDLKKKCVQVISQNPEVIDELLNIVHDFNSEHDLKKDPNSTSISNVVPKKRKSWGLSFK